MARKLPSSLPLLPAASDVLQKLHGQKTTATHQLRDCVCVYTEHLFGIVKGIKKQPVSDDNHFTTLLS